jgi:hypothetical protein
VLSANSSDPRRQRNAALGHKYIAGYWLGFNTLNSYQSEMALEHLQRAMALDEERVAKHPDSASKLDLSFRLQPVRILLR